MVPLSDFALYDCGLSVHLCLVVAETRAKVGVRALLAEVKTT